MTEDEQIKRADSLARLIREFEDEPSENQALKRAAANDVRKLAEYLVSRDWNLKDLEALVDALGEPVVVGAKSRVRRGFGGFSEAANSGDVTSFFDRSPVIGKENPIAPPLDLAPLVLEDGTRAVVGKGVFGLAYEGPPGHVHGGFLAAAFDEVCGMAQSLSGSPGMTARLTVNYRKPTPLEVEVVFEAKIIDIQGRKIYTQATSFVDGEKTAEADALFISIDFERLASFIKPSK